MEHSPSSQAQTAPEAPATNERLPPSLAIEDLLRHMHNSKASDLYLTYGAAPAFRIDGKIQPYGNVALTDEHLETLFEGLLNEDQMDDFEGTLELNTSLSWHDTMRLRINAFRQMQHNAIVIRRIETQIPTLEELKLPDAYRNLIMRMRGLILVVGQTGSGKSTSLAAMIDHRNQHSSGHIITIEDPIEYIHEHKNCIISQRDIGIDTYSFGMALKNALRQQPDVILIGEIRDREAMEHALNFSETGHLCVATLHANNSSQAIERILSFFPEEQKRQITLNLSLNIRGILSQRLVPNMEGSRSLATEILLNEGAIKTHIRDGNVSGIKEAITAAGDIGMQTFDQSLLQLIKERKISIDEALNQADNPSNLRLSITQWQRESMMPNPSIDSSNMQVRMPTSPNQNSDF